jgi:hypothetical protein
LLAKNAGFLNAETPQAKSKIHPGASLLLYLRVVLSGLYLEFFMKNSSGFLKAAWVHGLMVVLDDLTLGHSPGEFSVVGNLLDVPLLHFVVPNSQGVFQDLPNTNQGVFGDFHQVQALGISLIKTVFFNCLVLDVFFHMP